VVLASEFFDRCDGEDFERSRRDLFPLRFIGFGTTLESSVRSRTSRSILLREGRPAARKRWSHMAFILWVLAVVLVVSGIVAILRKQYLWGVVLIIVGLLVGPGGVSLFT
jgi:hypothetical protein